MSDKQQSDQTAVLAKKIKFIVFDVDGVLTDGSILIDDRGVETKQFYVRDGTAIRAAERQGIMSGVLTGRSSQATAHRMRELGIEHYIQGCKNKATGIEQLTRRAQVKLEETAYLGDDIIDLPAIARCGLAMAVADGAEEVLQQVNYITQANGGRGAARQAVEYILKAQGKWEKVLAEYNSLISDAD